MSDTHDFKFELGQRLVDTISGFEGIVQTRSQWLNNCNTYAIIATKLQDGKPIDAQWFDEPQLKAIKEKPEVRPVRNTGGPATRVPCTARQEQ